MREVAERLERARRVAIFSHVDPDGDAAGSALGLAHVLRDSGRDARVFLPGGAPDLYRFLPGADGVEADPDGVPADRDLLVVVDATSPSRLAGLEGALGSGPPVVNVDHHGDNTRFGAAHWVDPGACATALMVYEWARAAGLSVSPAAATCLYAGIVTDTGRFTFSNTDARCLAAAAALAALGASPHEIAVSVYDRASPASVRLLAAVLSTLDLRAGGRIASVHVTRAMLEETGARAEDSDGFSTYPRSIDGVQVGLFFRETEEGAVKVSFRSNGGVRIDGVAGRFQGGGHPSASGARVPGPLSTAKEAVVRAVEEHLRGSDG
jgi:phosphoesterase RecJ-like protein